MKHKALVAIGLLSMAAGAWAEPADDIKNLLLQGKDKQAYELGRAAPERLGEPAFDFYFGIAALNAGAPGEGVLALERYLLQFPDNRSAQFQLARGYYILGEDQRARKEFEALAPAAQGDELQSIQRFLDAIRARESRYKPTASAFAELGFGRDSNINSGVASGQIAGLPSGFIVAPGQTSERVRGSFGSAAAGVQGVYPVAPGVSLYGGAAASWRVHPGGRADVFDQQLASVQGGATALQGRNLVRVGLDFTTLAVDNQRYLGIGTLSGEWHRQVDQYNRFGLGLQWSRQSYHDVTTFLDLAQTVPVTSEATVRDSDVLSASAFWNRTLDHPWQPVLSVSTQFASEHNRRDRPDLSRDIWGLRLGATVQPAAKWTLAGALAWQASRHGAEFAPGVDTRRDRFVSLDLSAAYALDRRWSLRTEYQHVSQHSNIGLYQYQRNVLALKLRYQTP
ncbi:MAG: outer membrane beta-barrel protein [Pseudomonadota bacterium]